MNSSYAIIYRKVLLLLSTAIHSFILRLNANLIGKFNLNGMTLVSNYTLGRE